MTSSSDLRTERGLDAMLIVYSLLNDHPASLACERFIRNMPGWFTTVLTLLEAHAILTKVYSVGGKQASQKLAQFAAGPILVVSVDLATALAATSMADALNIDLTDAVLLEVARSQSAVALATDDTKLANACEAVGITSESPISAALRQEMAAWEAANLPAKGLPRVLRQIHGWLGRMHRQAADDFWSQTGLGSHLP